MDLPHTGSKFGSLNDLVRHKFLSGCGGSGVCLSNISCAISSAVSDVEQNNGGDLLQLF